MKTPFFEKNTKAIIVHGSFKNGVSEWESESNHFVLECTCICPEYVYLN